MDGLGLTLFDLAGLAVVVLSAIMAFARGLIREIFSIIAFIGAAIAAVYFSRQLQPVVEQYTALEGGFARVGAGLGIFLVVFIVITVLTAIIAKTAHQSTEIGAFDRAAGLAYGVLRGVLVVSLFVLLMRQATDGREADAHTKLPPPIENARTYPIYRSVAIALEHFLPGVGGMIEDASKADSPKANAPVPPAEKASDPEPPAEKAPASP